MKDFKRELGRSSLILMNQCPGARFTFFREDEMHISIPEADLGISKRRERQKKAGILGAALEPPVGSGQSLVGVQG
jgi:hypothetical protein